MNFDFLRARVGIMGSIHTERIMHQKLKLQCARVLCWYCRSRCEQIIFLFAVAVAAEQIVFIFHIYLAFFFVCAHDGERVCVCVEYMPRVVSLQFL